MKKFLKILGIAVLIVVVLIAAILIYFNATYPKVPPAKQLTVSSTPERIQRGAYLAEHVTLCIDCHSERLFKICCATCCRYFWQRGGTIRKRKYGFSGKPVR